MAGRHRALAKEHIRLAFPESSEQFIDDTCKSCFIGLGEHLLELCVVRRRAGLVDEIVKTDPEDMAPLDDALSEGNGCIVITGHIGSWELAARALARRGYGVAAVARRFHDPGLGALVESFRAAGGVETLPRGEPKTVRRLLTQLRSGGMIFMLVDQDTSVPSVHVPFFGRLAKTPRGPADLVYRTGVSLVMGFIHREGSGGSHRVRAERLVPPEPTGDRDRDARALMERINSRIEAEIRACPADWVWFHERWRSRPKDHEVQRGTPAPGEAAETGRHPPVVDKRDSKTSTHS